MFAAQRRTKCSHFEGREGCHAVERVLKICCLFMTNFYGCALGEIGKRTGWCNWWSWQTTRYLICETVCETDGEGVGRGQDRRWVCLFLLGCLSCHYILQTSCRIFLFSLWTSFSKKKKQAKQNVEMKMWSSSRPDLKLGDVTPNRLGLFLSLFPFFLILNFLLNGCRHSCEKRGIQSSRDVTTQAFWWANTRPECCNFPLVHWTLEKAAHLQSEWKRDEAVARICYHYLENVVGNEVQKERNYCKSR